MKRFLNAIRDDQDQVHFNLYNLERLTPQQIKRIDDHCGVLRSLFNEMTVASTKANLEAYLSLQEEYDDLMAEMFVLCGCLRIEIEGV